MVGNPGSPKGGESGGGEGNPQPSLPIQPCISPPKHGCTQNGGGGLVAVGVQSIWTPPAGFLLISFKNTIKTGEGVLLVERRLHSGRRDPVLAAARTSVVAGANLPSL